MVESRANGVLSSLGGVAGLREILSGRDSEKVWAKLKRRADQESFRLVLKSEMTLQRSGKSKGTGGHVGSQDWAKSRDRAPSRGPSKRQGSPARTFGADDLICPRPSC